MDHFVRYMGQDDDIAKALDQGYESGLTRGRYFEAGFIHRQVSDLIAQGGNTSDVLDLITNRLEEMRIRNARVR